MADIPNAVAAVYDALGKGMRKATMYVEPRLVVSACRRSKFSARHTRDDIVLKVGVPNYKEREFLKRLKKAGDSYPTGWIDLQPWPKKKAPK